MKNNQLGFTYPLTLCLLILFQLFLSMQIEQLVIERKLAHETALLLREEYYFFTSLKKIEELFQTGGTIAEKGTISYEFGSMDYQAEPPTGYVQKVNFTLRLDSGEAIIGRGFFDTRTKRLNRWVE